MQTSSSYSSSSSSPSSSPLSNSPMKRGPKNGQLQPFKVQTEQKAQLKEKKLRGFVSEEAKQFKPQNLPKPPVKEQTKPLNIKLHSEQRAARRAGFNDLVASKIKSLELLRRFEEKIQKVIEEEDIKSMRKEMVPKAQLMPLFDRPFTPQRSNRPLTVPKEPRVLRMNKKCSINEDPYTRCTNILLKL